MAPFLSVYSTLVVVDVVADDVVAVAVVDVVVREFGFHPKFIRSSENKEKEKLKCFGNLFFFEVVRTKSKMTEYQK